MLEALEADELEPAKPLSNVAIGKTATQSSLSQWSSPGEASSAISGAWPSDYAFHTEREPAPWWMVDLGGTYPLEGIVVHNRVFGFQERARTLKVEVSEEGHVWKPVHMGYARFGARGSGKPLELWLRGDLLVRFVKISLDEEEYLHLSQVEVLVRSETLGFARFCERTGISRDIFYSGKANSLHELEVPTAATSYEVVGLRINYSGRFGNLLHQYINAIQLAERTGLKFIQLGSHELLNVQKEFRVGEITFLPPQADLPRDGTFIAGEFFNSDDFTPVLTPFLRFRPEDELAFTAVVQKYIVPHMLTGIPLPDEMHPEDEVTIHLRAGDIFSSDHPVTYGYRQPPLSYYVLVLSKLLEEKTISRVRLVFEDRGNPCVDALEDWLKERNIPVRIQNGSLHQDMSALIDAPHLVFGHGTFGYAAVRLSRRIKTVHYFAPELGGSYGFIPTIERVFEVSDRAGDYIRAYEYGVPFGSDEGWRNTPEMRERMLTYPTEALEMRELPPPSAHR